MWARNYEWHCGFSLHLQHIIHPQLLEVETHFQRQQWRLCVLSSVMASIANPWVVILTYFLPAWPDSGSVHSISCNARDVGAWVSTTDTYHSSSSYSIDKVAYLSTLEADLLKRSYFVANHLWIRVKALEGLCWCAMAKMSWVAAQRCRPWRLKMTRHTCYYEDYIKWCLSAMYKNEASRAGEKKKQETTDLAAIKKRIWVWLNLLVLLVSILGQ